MQAVKDGNRTQPPECSGDWQDGRSIASTPVRVKRLLDQVVMTFANGRILSHKLQDVEISSHMASVPLRLTFSDGTLLTVPDGEVALALARGKSAYISLLETNLRKYLLPLLSGAALIIWLFVTFALPMLAYTVAQRFSVDFINSLGGKFFAEYAGQFEQINPHNSEEATRLKRLGAEALAVADADDYNYNFILAKGGIANNNAFAFPDGHIVMGQSLSKQLNDDEVFGVLSHEIAHVENRHTIQTLVRVGSWYVISSLLFGDYSFILAPAVLFESFYSRKHEAEADCYGAHLLENAQRPAFAMLTSLEKIYQQNPDEADYFPEGNNRHKPSKSDQSATTTASDETLVATTNEEVDTDVSATATLNANDDTETAATKNDDDDDLSANEISKKLLNLLASHPPYEQRVELLAACVGWDS